MTPKAKTRKWGLRKFLVAAAICVAGIVVLSCAGCITSVLVLRHCLKQGGYLEEWSKGDGEEITGLVYDKTRDLKYDMYIPKDLDKEKNVPLLLFVHGGAWKVGRRQDISYACKYYAKHGCITATLDYSLYSDEHKENTMYTMLDEITACIGAMKSELSGRGYRTPRIALGGFSAGGHLALLYAYSRAAESPLPIAFTCVKVGPSDFGEKAWGAEMSAGLVLAGTGKTLSASDLDKPEGKSLVDSVSPVAFVTAASAPTIFAYGGKDNLVKRHHRDVLSEALKKNGVEYIGIDFPNSHHGMWNDPEKVEEFRKAVLTYCERYMK